MSIVISGASGDLGRRITTILLQHVPARELILLTRNPASLADRAAEGAQVRQADFEDTEGLKQAMKVGQVLMLISTLSIGRRALQHGNAIQAASAAGIGHVVYTSSCGIQPQNPSLSGQEHLATERILTRSGLNYSILRNSWYADVIAQLLLPAGVAMGGIVASTGDGLVAPVAKEDCARTAAAILLKHWQHENTIYEVTGPELLSFADITRICSEESGRPIRYIDVSHAEKLAIFDAMGVQRDYEEGMMNDNTNAWASNEMITYEMAIKRQFFSICSNHVAQVTGQRAMGLREVIRQLGVVPPA
jgi:NAD(P)H dehydrogenase (quinone)